MFIIGQVPPDHAPCPALQSSHRHMRSASRCQPGRIATCSIHRSLASSTLNMDTGVISIAECMLQDVASHAIPEVNSSGYQLDLSQVRPAGGHVNNDWSHMSLHAQQTRDRSDCIESG